MHWKITLSHFSLISLNCIQRDMLWCNCACLYTYLYVYISICIYINYFNRVEKEIMQLGISSTYIDFCVFCKVMAFDFSFFFFFPRM